MNNNEKLNLLYEKYWSYIKNVCLKYTKNVEDAEDCAQDAFLKISKVLDKIDLQSCKTYITRIAINNTIDYIRHNKYKKKEEDIDDCYESLREYSTDFDEFQYNDLKQYITSSIESESKICCDVFKLYAIENYKHKEISEECNMNVNTVRVDYMKSKNIAKKYLLKESI